MKIILATNEVFPFHGYGGAQRFVYKLAKNLQKQGIDVVIFTKTTGETDLTIKYLENIKVVMIPQLIPVPFKKMDSGVYKQTPSKKGFLQTLLRFPVIRGLLLILNNYIWMSRLARLLQKSEFDLVHSFSSSSLIYQSKKNHNSTLVHLWDIGNRNLSHKRVFDYRKKIDLVDIQLSYLLDRSKNIVTCGLDYSRELENIFNVPNHKLHFIPNGIDRTLTHGHYKKNKSLRNELGIKDNEIVLINVNRLEPDKRIHFVIDIFDELKKTLQNVKLIIIGTGSLENNLKSMIKKSKNTESIIHLKNLKDKQLYNYLFSSDIFLNVALTRYMLLTVMEAMACKLPIISTAPLDGLVSDGVNGFVLDSKSPSTIVKNIISMVKCNELDTMGNNSFERIKDYTWENVAEKAIDAYENILQKTYNHN